MTKVAFLSEILANFCKTLIAKPVKELFLSQTLQNTIHPQCCIKSAQDLSKMLLNTNDRIIFGKASGQ